MSDLRNKIKALKVAALVAMGTATAGNANAQTPSSVTKDDTNTDKIENVQDSNANKEVFNVDLDSLSTPELLDYLIEIGPKREKKFSDNETEYSVPFGGGKRVAKVVNSNGSYFYGISVGKNAAGRVDVNKLRDMSCMNGAYSLGIRPDGTFYKPEYIVNNDKGVVERTDYERGFKGNVHDTDNRLRTEVKKTITAILKNKENKKTYQLTNQDYAKMKEVTR